MSTAWFETLGVFDLETTGIDVETSRVVSAHVGVIGPDGEVVEGQDWLADPGVDIPVQASAVHGITTERARAEGRPPREVVGEIVAALNDLFTRGIAVTIYNAPYDLSLLSRDARRNGLAPLVNPAPIVDPLVVDKAMDRYRRGKRTLEVAAELYGVELLDAHTAGADAVAAGRVAQAIAFRFSDDLPNDAFELHAMQVGWYAEQSASFQDYMRTTRDPSFTTSGAWPER
jgi:DNA polymerase III subunit epsilon